MFFSSHLRRQFVALVQTKRIATVEEHLENVGQLKDHRRPEKVVHNEGVRLLALNNRASLRVKVDRRVKERLHKVVRLVRRIERLQFLQAGEAAEETRLEQLLGEALYRVLRYVVDAL